MSKANGRMFLFLAAITGGAGYIMTHRENNPWGIAIVGSLMIVIYLMFMATLSKQSNMISYFVSSVE